jgi:homoserine O-acetyltransferase
MSVAAPQLPRVVQDDRYALAGREDAPVVAVLGGISATARSRDWWPAVVHAGGDVDLDRFGVLGVEYLDGGETSEGFPARDVTTHDQADALAETLDALELDRIHTLVGASYGGMVALAFAERHPDRVDQLVVVSAPARAHPMAVALRSIQRQIVTLALESGRGAEGLALARQLAVTTYRSAEEFGERFDADLVQRYLKHQGEKFAARFRAARFLALSRSVDTHLVDAARITTPATLIAARGDAIVPLAQMRELADTLAGPSVLRVTQTNTGHDAFLAEPHAAGAIIRNALLNPLA